MKLKTIKNLRSLVKDSYQEVAKEFDISRKKEIWPKLRELADLVPNKAKVLDLGCGNGRLLQAFINRPIDYIGCDPEPKLLDLAADSWPGYKFKIADILNLDDLPENNFDYIFCIAVWHHVPGKDNRQQALLEIQKKLKPGGKAIISVWNLRKSKPLLVWKSWLEGLLKERLDFGDVIFPWRSDRGESLANRYYHAFGRREIKKLVKKSELNLDKLEKDEHNYWLVLSKRNED